MRNGKNNDASCRGGWTGITRNCCIAALALIVLVFAFGCIGCRESKKTDETAQPKAEIEFELDIDPLGGFNNVGCDWEISGGTGEYKDGMITGYEYSGEPVELELKLNNKGKAWEYGMGVCLNGVFQKSELVTDGQVSETKTTHVLRMAAGEKRTITLRFTPSVGKAGEVLAADIFTVYVPSFKTPYNGKNMHPYAPVQRMHLGFGSPLRFKVDAPNAVQPFEPEDRSVAVPNEYVEYMEEYIARTTDPEARKMDREQYLQFALYSDPPGISGGSSFSGSYMLAEDERSLTAYFELFGPPRDYRITVFIDHEPVEFAPGQTYFDLSSSLDTLSKVKLEIPLDPDLKDPVIYATLVERVTEPKPQYLTGLLKGEKLYYEGFPTLLKYLFIGSVPEVANAPEPSEASETVPETPETEQIELETGAQLKFHKQYFLPAYLAKTDDGRLVVGELDRAEIYNLKEDRLETIIYLPDNTLLMKLAGDRLITVQNPAFDDAAVNIFDLSGELIDRFELHGSTGLNEEAQSAFSTQISGTQLNSFSQTLMISEDGACLIYEECTMDKAGLVTYGNTYRIDLLSGERTVCALEKNKVDIPCYFDGSRFAVCGYYNTNYDCSVSLYSLDNHLLNTCTLKAEEDGTHKRVCSVAGTTALLCDEVSMFTASKPTGKLTLLDLDTFETREFAVEGNDSTWAKLSPDGKLILTMEGDEPRPVFRLYDLETGTVIRRFSVQTVFRPWYEGIAYIDTENRNILVQNTFKSESGSDKNGISSFGY